MFDKKNDSRNRKQNLDDDDDDNEDDDDDDDSDDDNDESDNDNNDKSSKSSEEISSKERKKLIKKAFKEFKEGDWKCREVGIIPDFEDCRKYFICSEKKHKIKKSHLKCPKNTLFDWEKEKCVYKKKAECADKKYILNYLGKFRDFLD